MYKAETSRTIHQRTPNSHKKCASGIGSRKPIVQVRFIYAPHGIDNRFRPLSFAHHRHCAVLLQYALLSEKLPPKMRYFSIYRHMQSDEARAAALLLLSSFGYMLETRLTCLPLSRTVRIHHNILL